MNYRGGSFGQLPTVGMSQIGLGTAVAKLPMAIPESSQRFCSLRERLGPSPLRATGQAQIEKSQCLGTLSRTKARGNEEVCRNALESSQQEPLGHFKIGSLINRLTVKALLCGT